jgi:hypothetical protein
VEVWRAARRWLHAQDANAVGARMDFKDRNFGAPTWRAFWRPYWLAKRAIPSWLPLAPNEATFLEL